MHRANGTRVDGTDEGICNAADLHEIAHAEGGERDKHAVDARKVWSAETVGDIIHRSAADAPAAVIYRESDLGVFYDHPDERRCPQPEECAGTAHGDSLRHTDYVARADR